MRQPGGVGGATVSSLANSVMITTFNMAWRAIAIKLSAWENYRLTMRMRENLTYKLFIFQCSAPLAHRRHRTPASQPLFAARVWRLASLPRVWR